MFKVVDLCPLIILYAKIAESGLKNSSPLLKTEANLPVPAGIPLFAGFSHPPPLCLRAAGFTVLIIDRALEIKSADKSRANKYIYNSNLLTPARAVTIIPTFLPYLKKRWGNILYMSRLASRQTFDYTLTKGEWKSGKTKDLIG
jgi:hypothetical protein